MKLRDARFVTNMRCSFQDRYYIYMLFEYMPGGDLQKHLTKQGTFTEEQTSKLYLTLRILRCLHHDGFGTRSPQRHSAS